MLYPLTFHPAFQERVWGGRDLERLYRKPLPPGVPIGESWEIADRPDVASVIANGPLAGRNLRWLMENRAVELMGEATAPHGRFPLLVKILDAQQVLSVQVHPPAEVAPKLGGEPKTEMWFVTRAAPRAQLLAGLRRGVERAEFERKLADGTVGECIHSLTVRAGDALFVPSGRIHALGAGLVIFEIQQNSDTTYRVFDWNRVGTDGRPRALHVAQAMASIDFRDFEPGLIATAWETHGAVRLRRLVTDPLFTVNELHLPANHHERPANRPRPRIFAVVSGRLKLVHPGTGVTVTLTDGQFGVVPASVNDVELTAEAPVVCLVAEPGVAAT